MKLQPYRKSNKQLMNARNRENVLPKEKHTNCLSIKMINPDNI